MPRRPHFLRLVSRVPAHCRAHVREHARMADDAATFDPPRALVDLRPPPELTALHRLWEIAILGGLGEDGLIELGLNEEKVLRLLDNDQGDGSAEAYRSVWASSKAGGTEWMSIAQPWFARPSEGWLAVLAGAWSLHNSFMDAALLDTGAIGNRANCLLYLTQAGATVTDVQFTYAQAAAQVAEGKTTAFDDAAFMAGSLATGAVVGALTMGAGIGLVTQAVSWAGGKLVEVDPWTEELTLRWLLASQLAEDDPDRTRHVAQAFYSEAGALSRTQPSASQGRKIRMLLAAYHDLITETESDGIAATATMPNVVGMRLSDATDALRALGLRVDSFFDAARPPGEDRVAIRKSAWIVRGQQPEPDFEVERTTNVVLAYSKADERVLANDLAARLASHSRAPND